jgi:hypothetical protein
MKIFLKKSKDREKFISLWKNEARKLNSTIHIEFGLESDSTLSIWISR